MNCLYVLRCNGILFSCHCIDTVLVYDTHIVCCMLSVPSGNFFAVDYSTYNRARQRFGKNEESIKLSRRAIFDVRKDGSQI